MKKTLVSVVFAVAALVAAPVALAQFQEATLWGPAVVAGLNGKAFSILVLVSNEDQGVSVGFSQAPPPTGVYVPYPPLTVNGQRGSRFDINLRAKQIEWFEIRDDDRYDLLVGWLYLEAPLALDGVLIRVVDGKTYTSSLTKRGYRFEFVVKEEKDVATAVAMVVDGGLFFMDRSDITLELFGADGRPIATRVFTRIPQKTQISRFLWEYFVTSPEEWSRLVGKDFRGTLRVSVQGAFVGATAVYVSF